MRFLRLIAVALVLFAPAVGRAASDDSRPDSTPSDDAPATFNERRAPLDALARALEPQPPLMRDPVGWLVWPFELKSAPVLKQSVFVFGGLMTSDDIWSTAIFNLHRPDPARYYQNNIVGIAYQRDLLHFNSGALIGVEVGIAGRFGHYIGCCDHASYSDTLHRSAEFWTGATLRHEGITFFDAVRVSPGFVFGLSQISNAIGQETELYRTTGSTKLLFYMAFEGAFALAAYPDSELVLRLHHRSGAYGTLGERREGNNANTFGFRQRF